MNCEHKMRKQDARGKVYTAACGAPAARCEVIGALARVFSDLCAAHQCETAAAGYTVKLACGEVVFSEGGEIRCIAFPAQVAGSV